MQWQLFCEQQLDMNIYIPFPCPVVHFTTSYSRSSTGSLLSSLFSISFFLCESHSAIRNVCSSQQSDAHRRPHGQIPLHHYQAARSEVGTYSLPRAREQKLTIQIDWNLVAAQLEISNGHAARMRFSRFKQQMEGVTSTPRASKPKKTTRTGSEKGSKPGLEKGVVSPPPAPPVKQETGTETAYDPGQSPYIKTESEPYLQRIPTLEDPSMPSTLYTRPLQPYRPQQQFYRQQYPSYAYSPYTTYTPYSPMTVAPPDLTMSASMSQFSSPTSIGFEVPSSVSSVWNAKNEGGDGGSNEPVKSEGGQET